MILWLLIVGVCRRVIHRILNSFLPDALWILVLRQTSIKLGFKCRINRDKVPIFDSR